MWHRRVKRESRRDGGPGGEGGVDRPPLTKKVGVEGPLWAGEGSVDELVGPARLAEAPRAVVVHHVGTDLVITFPFARANVVSPAKLLVLHVFPRDSIGVIDPFLFLFRAAGSSGCVGGERIRICTGGDGSRLEEKAIFACS